MGVSRSPEQLARKLAHAASAIGDNKVAVERTALAVKGVFLDSLRASGVSGSTKISRKVKARYDVKGTRNPTALVRYTGPAHLLNNPTKPHSVVSRRNRRSRKWRGSRDSGVGLKGAVLVNGQPKAYAAHPGTRGLHFFQRAKPIAAVVAPKVYERVGFTEPLRRIF